MRDKEKDAARMAEKRRRILEEGYRLFSEKSIEQVSMTDVAKACGYGIATLYRYFNTKLTLVVAVGTWIWENYFQETVMQLSDSMMENMTAAQIFDTHLDYYIDLYKNHADLLRFNQFFNIYVQGQGATTVQLLPYLGMIEMFKERFHIIREKALEDGTLRTDLPEEEMFAGILHIMLAAVTRYAVGLVYISDSGKNDEKELLLLKEMFLREYTVSDSNIDV